MSSNSPRVLLVGDDSHQLKLSARLLQNLGYIALVANSGTQALHVLETEDVDFVLADEVIEAPQPEFLKVVSHQFPKTEIILMVAERERRYAREEIPGGSLRWLQKPLRPEQVIDSLRRGAVVEGKKQKVPAAQGDSRLGTPLPGDGFEGMIGASPKMQEVYDAVRKVAMTRHPVLILGESGTGKELLARAIHTSGPWSGQPFVPVDCGSLSPTLIESELFGHVKGAFTGATQDRKGLLAAAGNGTVFLDEVAELPVELQSKLLRALQEREVKPIGTNLRTRVEARIIAATNQDLQAAMQRGGFRRELYFRLNVVRLKLPPLRKRREDIPALVRFFARKHAVSAGQVPAVSEEALALMINYDWPGNIRELENAVQHALTLGSGESIRPRDLPSTLVGNSSSRASSQQLKTLSEMEKKAILQALAAAEGDRVRAAKLLGISKTTIYRKLKEYGIDP